MKLPSLRLSRCWFALLSLISAGANPAFAEKADRDKPVNIEANRAEVNDLTQVSVYSGRVILTKGTLILRCDTLQIRQDPEGFQYGTCIGKQASFKQRRDLPNQFIDGTADRIDYDGKQESAKFAGNAVIRRLQGDQVADEAKGPVVTYDGKTEQYVIDGSQNGKDPDGRIRVTIAPKSTNTPPPPSKGSVLRADPKVSNPR